MARRLRVNWQLVEQRRVLAGLSRVELAERLGNKGANLDYLWPLRNWNDNCGHIRLELLERLCQILDIESNEIFVQPDDVDGQRRSSRVGVASKADDAVLEAAIATITDHVGIGALAHALTWPPDRLCTALATLNERLADTGMRIDHDPGPPIVIRGLRAREALLKPAQIDALRHLTNFDGELSADDAYILYDIAVIGSRPTENSPTIDRAAAFRLQRQGYIERPLDSEGLIATRDVYDALHPHGR